MISKLSILAICFFISAESNSNKNEKTLKELIDALAPKGTNEKMNYKFAKLMTTHSPRSKRDTRPVEFQFDTGVIRLSLTPVSHNVLNHDLPVWTVESDSNVANGHFYKLVDKKKTYLDGIVYEDVKNKAILHAFYEDKKIFYDGVIGEGNGKKLVKHIPEKWYDTKIVGSYDHIIFEVDEKPITLEAEIAYPYYYINEPKLTKPLDTLHPKLLLVVEYNYFKSFDENILELIKYLSILWNAIQLKYSEISAPKVFIQITGIIIQKDSAALEFINLARCNTTDYLNSWTLVMDGTSYFQNEFDKEVNFKNYDSAVVLSTLADKYITGRAHVGKVCDKTVIYCQDLGGLKPYFGLMSITHEVGHSLGMTHDRNENLANPPSNTSFLFPVGYTLVDKYYWSQQSMDALKLFATTKRSECLNSSFRY